MGSMTPVKPTLRWGIIGTGWISTMFVTDLLVDRLDALAEHSIAAIGSSSMAKGESFVGKFWKDSNYSKPAVYEDYRGVYEDHNVDIVYVGTPHALHKQNCLDAIAAGKHVLCEKPLTINEKDAIEVVVAARQKGVFLMEAMWTRFVPIFEILRQEIVGNRSIGDVHRMFVDFGNLMPLDTLPADSRSKDPALGAGALLDIGVYPLTYASLIMGDFKLGKQHPKVQTTSSLTIVDGMDESNVVVLNYPTGKTAICSSTFRYRSGENFARIEGSAGEIVIFGPAGSVPMGFRLKSGPRPGVAEEDNREERTYTVEKPVGALGFFWEADAVALDIAAGRLENATMPLDESLRMMRLMDDVRRQNGLLYPQDS